VSPTQIIAALGGAVLMVAAFPALAGVPPTPAPTTTTLTATPNPVTLTQTTQLKATIVPSPAAVCTGTVGMATSGGTALCGNALVSPDGANYSATCNLTGSAIGPVGPVSVIATYDSADAACANSASAATTVTVAADSVPTVGEWTLWGLMGLMMMGGAALLVRRTRGLSQPQL
jgi:hypothetical protein